MCSCKLPSQMNSRKGMQKVWKFGCVTSSTKHADAQKNESVERGKDSQRQTEKEREREQQQRESERESSKAIERKRQSQKERKQERERERERRKRLQLAKERNKVRKGGKHNK